MPLVPPVPLVRTVPLVRPPPGLEPMTDSSAPADSGGAASSSGGIAPIKRGRDDVEEIERPQSPRPTVRFKTKQPPTPSTTTMIPKRTHETSGATPPSKSVRVEDEDMKALCVHDDSVVLMLEDYWYRHSDADKQASKFKEFEKLIKFDTFERRSGVDTKIDLRWVETVGAGGELKSRLCIRGFKEPYKEGENTYAPTPLPANLKVVLCRAHRRKHCVQLADVSRAFLLAPMKDVVHIKPPPEWKDYVASHGLDHIENEVWLLRKAM